MKTLAVSWYNRIPQHIKEILHTLKKNGHIAYLAGGCVRDFLLELTPKDFDIATDADPEQVASLFPKTLDIGKAFGIMMIVTPEETVEVARFRTDGQYNNHRHPDSVTFSNPEEDAKRRDFTINALFYDGSQEQVMDYVGGLDDLSHRRIRAVGDPLARIQEDSLRMLRAVRFVAQLEQKGFSLDPELLRAIQASASKIRLVSKERITQEFFHILQSKSPISGLKLFEASGLWKELFAIPYRNDEVEKLWTLWNSLFGEASQSEPQHQENADTFLLAAIFSSSGKNFQADLAPFVLFSSQQKKNLHWILDGAADLFSVDLANRKTAAIHPCWREGLVLKANQRSRDELLQWMQWRKQNEKNLDPPPLVNGSDLLALGIPSGPELGRISKLIRQEQLREQLHTKDDAVKLAQQYLKNSASKT